MESIKTFLDRINMLEQFKQKRYGVEPVHFRPLFDKAKLYATESYSTDEHLTSEERKQINVAYAIKTADVEWLKENMFEPNYHSQDQVCDNYQLFKHVFAWLLPLYPTNCDATNRTLCQLLGQVHKIDEIFYHWSWYAFPHIIQHFTYVDEAVTFLIAASTTINLTPHTWEGQPDKESDSLGRRPRPIMQLLWRTAMFSNYQESGFVRLFRRLVERNVDFDKMWILLDMEFTEARNAALWEEPGREFRHMPCPLLFRHIKENIPFHVFFNGSQVRFVPYLARAIKKELGLVPDVMMEMLMEQAKAAGCE